jgi:hypothetical protein
MSKGKWCEEQGRIEFAVPLDQGEICNLKSHLSSSLKKAVVGDTRVCSTTVPFSKRQYSCHSEFPNKELRKQFEDMFYQERKKGIRMFLASF